MSISNWILFSITSIIILTPLLFLYFNYIYIITNVEYSHGKIKLSKLLRYNRYRKTFEGVDVVWDDEDIIDIKKYDHKYFVNGDIAEKYIRAKEEKKKEITRFKYTPYTKYDRISLNIKNN